LIRSACPSVLAPMQTGDGLLARLVVNEPMALDTFDKLCEAAETQGNGIIEVTQRGNLQIRGLTEVSAPIFARAVSSLGIGAGSHPPLLTSPLLGLGADEPFDCTTVVSSLQTTLQALRTELESLAPKVSVLIDGGGKLHLDAIPADIRLVATSNSLFQLSLAGDSRTACFVGYVSMNRVAASVEDLLRLIARQGPQARARDLVTRLNFGPAPPNTRVPSEPVGIHPLEDESVARGFALPFGHSTAGALRLFARVAADHGATSIRPAPGRSLLAIGLSNARANELRGPAVHAGLIADPHDERRQVVACAGAPACASAKLPTRELAPEVARAARTLVGTSDIVHLSGCSKGCAHSSPAAVTIVGPDHIILNGCASDTPHATISPAGLVADIERLCSRAEHA
jgi:precorrin-3B synthase